MQTDTAAITAINPAKLPPIGTDIEGGKFAGVSLFNDQRVALILLPAKDDNTRTHAEACAWAKEQGGDLPTRIDGTVLYANLRDEFDEDWYWLSEAHPRYADCAWIQSFDLGSQGDGPKSYDDRCRAVRRVPI